MVAPILWAPGKMRSFCKKNHADKTPRFRWAGYLGFFGGVGSADSIFMDARVFLIASLSYLCQWYSGLEMESRNEMMLLHYLLSFVQREAVLELKSHQPFLAVNLGPQGNKEMPVHSHHKL